MRKTSAVIILLLLLVISFGSAFAQGSAAIEVFSPQGTVKGVRQVSARFSEQVVPFGEPRIIEPFDITCSEKGQGRWVDGKNWVFDFSADLPAGIRCEFRLKPDLKTLSGKPVSGQQQFFFSTGGPAIKESYPGEGSAIAEDQIFLLFLDAAADSGTIESNVTCSVEGVTERVGVTYYRGRKKRRTG